VQYPEEKAVGRLRRQYLKQVTRNAGADTFTATEKWLAIIPDGKLPKNPRLKNKKKTITLVCRLRVVICELLQKSSTLLACVIKPQKVMWVDI
jgi:hypothetical protein